MPLSIGDYKKEYSEETRGCFFYVRGILILCICSTFLFLYGQVSLVKEILILAGLPDKIKETIKCDERTLSATVQTLPIIVYYSLLIKPLKPQGGF